MNELVFGKLLLYIGIAVMLTAVAGGLICILVFTITGRKLKVKLEKEYGKQYGR